MTRKRLTQRFPFLLPLRRAQRIFCFHLAMRFDGNTYAKTQQTADLPYTLYDTASPLLNEQTGFDMKYQQNKVFNLKLAAKTLDGLLIQPGETFSFWRQVRYADKKEPYKEGLCLREGKLVTVTGGGMCQMSNLLFWLFLHSPLEVIERHGHQIKDFPSPPGDLPEGVDATVSQGWADLKVYNPTDAAYQIRIAFDAQSLRGWLRTDQPPACRYEIQNKNLSYQQQDGKIIQQVDLYRQCCDLQTGAVTQEQFLYHNACPIGYPLPPDTPVQTIDSLPRRSSL